VHRNSEALIILRVWPSLDRGAKSFNVSLKNAFGHAQRFLFGKGKRPAGARVVRVAGDDVGMQMRERVPEQV
jgi:hypothetical protein